jgi:hypothetical protein
MFIVRECRYVVCGGRKVSDVFFPPKNSEKRLGGARERGGGGADLTFVLRTLILKKNTWNFLGFFSSPLFFYECRPYLKWLGSG